MSTTVTYVSPPTATIEAKLDAISARLDALEPKPADDDADHECGNCEHYAAASAGVVLDAGGHLIGLCSACLDEAKRCIGFIECDQEHARLADDVSAKLDAALARLESIEQRLGGAATKNGAGAG